MRYCVPRGVVVLALIVGGCVVLSSCLPNDGSSHITIKDELTGRCFVLQPNGQNSEAHPVTCPTQEERDRQRQAEAQRVPAGGNQ